MSRRLLREWRLRARLSHWRKAFHSVAWHYPDLKRPSDSPKPTFTQCELITGAASADFAAGVVRGNAVAAGQALTRGLQVLPGNTCTPEYLGARAREIAARHGFTVTVMDKAAITKAGMHALLAVAQGSALEPRFIVLEHRGSKAAPVVLVGKGVTFDTGGISMKPAQSMEGVKYDMSRRGCGARCLRGDRAAEAEAARDRIDSVVREHAVGHSLKTKGDVVGSHLGKTIEVVNTDAEGRLILADALSWARQYSPAAVIDCATLTGAIVIGLGRYELVGAVGTDRDLMDAVRAGRRRGRRACLGIAAVG